MNWWRLTNLFDKPKPEVTGYKDLGYYGDPKAPRLVGPLNPYALMTEKDLAQIITQNSKTGTTIAGAVLISDHLAKEIILRLSDYSFHLKRARRNSFILGMSAAFFLVGLVFWISSIIRGEM